MALVHMKAFRHHTQPPSLPLSLYVSVSIFLFHLMCMVVFLPFLLLYYLIHFPWLSFILSLTPFAHIFLICHLLIPPPEGQARCCCAFMQWPVEGPPVKHNSTKPLTWIIYVLCCCRDTVIPLILSQRWLQYTNPDWEASTPIVKGRRDSFIH